MRNRDARRRLVRRRVLTAFAAVAVLVLAAWAAGRWAYPAVLSGYRASTRHSEGLSWRRQGHAHLAAKQDTEAIRCYTKAIECLGVDPDVYFQRGYAYFNVGDFNRAVADWTEVIKLKPDSVDAYHNRGVAFVRQGDHVAGFSDLAVACTMKGDTDGAIDNWTQVIARSPGHVAAYMNRGILYFQIGESAEAHYDGGMACYKNGDYDGAIVFWTNAIRARPDWVEPYQLRGAAYCHRREYDKARHDWDRAAKLRAASKPAD
ncbi:MAG: tetratricopeptide repeat protein [Planctomycetota bacterium]